MADGGYIGPHRGEIDPLFGKPTAARCDSCEWTYTSLTWCTRFLDVLSTDHENRNPGHTVGKEQVA